MTTATLTEPAPVTAADNPPCEVRWQCESGHVSAPCPRPATERVTVHCADPGCDRAVEVLLACSRCAAYVERDAAAAGGRVTRRPL